MIWHSLPLRPPNCQKSRLTHHLLCPRKASHLHQHPIHHIHKMIQFLAKRWNDKKYPPKSNSDLVVVLKNQLRRTYCIRSFSETLTPIEFNSRSLTSRNGFRAFYNIFFISKYLKKKKVSQKQGFEKCYAKTSSCISLESEQNLPVPQKQFRPWYHTPQTQSFHPNPWGPHGQGMGPGHGGSGRPRSHTLPHWHPLIGHTACWEHKGFSSSPKRCSICHPNHKTTCRLVRIRRLNKHKRKGEHKFQYLGNGWNFDLKQFSTGNGTSRKKKNNELTCSSYQFGCSPASR